MAVETPVTNQRIILIPDAWRTRIAAGEVVERPASVVKELLENSIDAGAREVSVWVEGSGVSLIRVSDNGHGIHREDFPLALERHATSKLRDESDLFRVATLGFRGEALASIASVSRLEIVSRTEGKTEGCRLRVEGGARGEILSAGCPIGTTVEVRDLFFNTPARRRFLKSPTTEVGHIADIVQRTALAFSDRHFRLYRDGKLLQDYPAVGNVEERLRQVFGKDVAGSMISFAGGGGKVNIDGFVSTSPSSFPNSRYVLTYVNRRYVRDRILVHALLQGYETLLMKGRYPAAMLRLGIPYEEVDVNVHPAKYEVRFRRQSDVHDAVVASVREALRSKAKSLPSTSAGGREELFIGVGENDEPYPVRRASEESARLRASQKGIFGTERQEGIFSSLGILGQILGSYIVCSHRRGLVLIDQHAAHERLSFERMRNPLLGGKMERQELLVPQVLDLPFAEARTLEGQMENLEPLGFTVESFGSNAFAIRTVPAVLPNGDYRPALQRMVAECVHSGASSALRQGLEERLMTIACHSVIRAHRKLSPEEMRALLRDLDSIDFATQCPHGRPVLIEIAEEELARLFKRT